jgi:hypothetical protein
MIAANVKTERKGLRQIVKHQVVGKEEAPKPKRQLKRFREKFVGGQVIREEVNEAGITDAAFIVVPETATVVEQKKLFKGFSDTISDMVNDGKSVIVTAIAFD